MDDNAGDNPLLTNSSADSSDERDGHSGAAAPRGHDSVEAEAIRAEGLNPDDPAVRAALSKSP
jgi:hypothetical protein